MHEHTLVFALWSSEYHTGQQKHNDFLLTFLLVFFFLLFAVFVVFLGFFCCIVSLLRHVSDCPAGPAASPSPPWPQS